MLSVYALTSLLTGRRPPLAGPSGSTVSRVRPSHHRSRRHRHRRAHDAQRVLLARRRHRDVEPQHVGLHRARVVLEARDDTLRDAGEEDGEQVRPVLRVRGQAGEDARVEHGQQGGELGPGDPVRVGPVPARRCVVPRVLAGHRDEHLVEQGVAQSGHLRHAALAHVPVGPLVEDPDLGPAGRGPHPDHGVRVHDVGRRRAGGGQLPDRHLQHDAVDVDLGQGVDAGHGRRGQQVRRLERTERAQVEHRAEVDPEGVRSLPGEHPSAPGQVVGGLAGQLLVVRRGARTDVARRHP